MKQTRKAATRTADPRSTPYRSFCGERRELHTPPPPLLHRQDAHSGSSHAGAAPTPAVGQPHSRGAPPQPIGRGAAAAAAGGHQAESEAPLTPALRPPALYSTAGCPSSRPGATVAVGIGEERCLLWSSPPVGGHRAGQEHTPASAATSAGTKIVPLVSPSGTRAPPAFPLANARRARTVSWDEGAPPPSERAGRRDADRPPPPPSPTSRASAEGQTSGPSPHIAYPNHGCMQPIRPRLNACVSGEGCCRDSKGKPTGGSMPSTVGPTRTKF